MAFLAPLLEMGGTEAASLAAPAIEKIAGKEAGKILTPLAQKAIKQLASSKLVHSGISKLGNHLYGKTSKNARELMKKGGKIASFASSKQAHKMLGTGLDVGEALGVINGDKKKKILDAHKQAMRIHDTLSSFNKKKDPLKAKVDKTMYQDAVTGLGGKSIFD